jgi:hypothetical protein
VRAEQACEEAVQEYVRYAGCGRLEAVQFMEGSALAPLQKRQERVISWVKSALEGGRAITPGQSISTRSRFSHNEKAPGHGAGSRIMACLAAAPRDHHFSTAVFGHPLPYQIETSSALPLSFSERVIWQVMLHLGE